MFIWQRLSVRLFIIVPAALLSLLGLLSSAEHNAPALPRAFDKVVPESVRDLQEIQTHVDRLVGKVLSCTVGLRIGSAQGSGVIIDEEGHVLTAGHVSGEPGRKVEIILHNGRKLRGITLGANAGIDSGLVRITERATFPHASMARSDELRRGQWCLALGHPGGYQTGRAPVVRLGRLLENNAIFLRTDCALVGGDSGGPLFDMDGKVIGIHSRIGGSLTSNLHVPIDTYHETWDRLAAGEMWGNDLSLFTFARPSGAYLGVEADPDSRPLRILSVAPDSPAARAGVRAQDFILRVDQQRVGSFDELISQMRRMQPGTAVTLHVRRGEAVRLLNVVLGERPE
jgi:serine protease Do